MICQIILRRIDKIYPEKAVNNDSREAEKLRKSNLARFVNARTLI